MFTKHGQETRPSIPAGAPFKSLNTCISNRPTDTNESRNALAQLKDYYLAQKFIIEQYKYMYSILCVTTLGIHHCLHLSWHTFVERCEVDSVIIHLTLRAILFRSCNRRWSRFALKLVCLRPQGLAFFDPGKKCPWSLLDILERKITV